MKKSYGLTLLSVFTMGMTTPVFAQTQMVAAPQFLPASGWNIQKTPLAKVRGLQDLKLPCMMAVNFDNGYVLRLSGSNENILAMAVDFRQEIFTQGRKYGASVKVDDLYTTTISGTAFSKSVLVFNMREAQDFYQAIHDAAKMTLNVEDNPMVFALGDIKNALSELESCAGNEKKNIQQVSFPPKKISQPVGMPMTWEEEVAPVPARVSKEIKKAEMTKAPVWQAKAGDDMKATLERWAMQAGVDIDWQATQGGSVSDDISVQGTFEDAVQSLMARNATALGLDANMMAASTVVSSEPQQLVPARMSGGVSQPPVSMISAASPTGGKWSAPMGSSLQQVLQNWCKQAGVELIWQSNQGFAVKQPVSAGGSYEQALQSLLNQYTDEKVRPNAQLNNDPVTGRRTLFVQSSRVL